MGTKLTVLVEPKIVSYADLKGKTFAVDAHNILYQFLTTIRSYDGSYLTDKKGNVTSHLIGLFSRSVSLMEKGLKLCFVFDGQVPELKKEETIRRKELKNVALKKYELALAEKNIEEMKKQARRTSRLTKEMIKDAKELIIALGMPVVEAPSEGEAQAARMVKDKKVYAAISQDYDTLLFGCPRMIKNLTISKKRKIAGSYAMKAVFPELLELSQLINSTGLDQDKLIALGIMTGTDYCREGIKGIGPKKALKLLTENSIEKAFDKAKWNQKIAWKDIFNLIKNMPTKTINKLDWKSVDVEKVKNILVKKHDFESERVEKTLEKLNLDQKGLFDFV
jgi:flap endonuclease-1